MADETIVITEQNISQYLSNEQKTSRNRDVLLNPERKLWVTLGLPVNNESGGTAIEIPDKPHVFKADNLWVIDSRHNNLLLQNVTVIFAHGYRDGVIWKFANGQPVVDTVLTYDEHARRNNLSPIEFVIACNKEESDNNPLGIKIKDFFTSKVVAQSVGDLVQMHMGHKSQISEDGQITLTIEVRDGKFWGLDELVEHRSIQDQIKLT